MAKHKPSEIETTQEDTAVDQSFTLNKHAGVNNKYRCLNDACELRNYIAFYASSEPEIKECTVCHTPPTIVDPDANLTESERVLRQSLGLE